MTLMRVIAWLKAPFQSTISNKPEPKQRKTLIFDRVNVVYDGLPKCISDRISVDEYKVHCFVCNDEILKFAGKELLDALQDAQEKGWRETLIEIQHQAES